MRLAWSILFAVLCNAEQVTDVRPPDSSLDSPKEVIPLEEKHLRLLSSPASSPSTPLGGKHLRLIATPLPGIYNVKRNATGHVIQTAGPIPFALEWLSRRYNFIYSYIPIIGPMFVEDLPNQRGGISILRQGEAELYVAAVVPTPSRFKDADFSCPWLSGSYGILIPIPNSSTNIGALIEPMSTEIWICIALSIPFVMLSLFGLSKCIVALNKQMKLEEKESKPSKKNFGVNFKITDYVVSVLLSQGGYCARKQLAIRLAAAAWCLACFVLVQSYSCTLIAFITSPNNKPIINSVYDIPNVPELKITVNRNYGPDVTLQQTNFSIFKKLGDSLREDPSLRCNSTEICLDKVRTGNHVYIHGTPILQNIIAMDRKQTGTCHFTMASESFWPGHAYFLLSKKSPYTETISRGILRMQETGLLEKWIETFNPETTECSLKIKKNKIGNPQITLKNLTSAFALLLLGISVSILVFSFELIYRLFRFHSSAIDV